MCLIDWRPEMWDFEDYPSRPLRPTPRLTWVIPVDIVDLCASLEAFHSQIQQNTALRLCHRFGNSPLSTLPQEILDQVISHAHETTKRSVRPSWEKNYLCFQARCPRSHHLPEYGPDVEEIWSCIMEDDWYSDEDEDYEHDEQEKTEMVHSFLDDGSSGSYNEYLWEIHEARQDVWVKQMCCCRKAAIKPKADIDVQSLRELLRSHFGLDAVILHEAVSNDLRSFLPDSSDISEYSYYTSCFIGLPQPTQTNSPTQGRKAKHQNDGHLHAENHLAFYEKIDPNQFNISEEQKLRFARAMRILGLQPYYQLTELEDSIAADNSDEELWVICAEQLRGRPKPALNDPWNKKKLLDEYLQAKCEGSFFTQDIGSYFHIDKDPLELSKQTWPQLMMMATSDVVKPS